MLKEEIYEVLARTKREESLRIIGTVQAQSSRLAAAYAQATYDEFNYIDMQIVPRKHLVKVFSLNPIISKKGF
ncbi:hypothetical protein CVD28_05360 [Bacillus sp. M6-12]|uniref:hypothetical protein n=1 Tax=Bacillus sp. M6-12 TaxID=2054166 RepID=UPI000C75BA9A|nr:hypothetical protein [Bacillus sp. M6-12]PLS18567.1 hypothetical protein CVD28_05360 [Bacillus sp. M6-12]